MCMGTENKLCFMMSFLPNSTTKYEVKDTSDVFDVEYVKLTRREALGCIFGFSLNTSVQVNKVLGHMKG